MSWALPACPPRRTVQLHLWGHGLTAGSIIATLLIVFAGLLAVPAVSHTNAGTTFSLMASSMAFVAMGIAQFMATRPPFIEKLFGGLDRIYQFHRKIGDPVVQQFRHTGHGHAPGRTTFARGRHVVEVERIVLKGHGAGVRYASDERGARDRIADLRTFAAAVTRPG